MIRNLVASLYTTRFKAHRRVEKPCYSRELTLYEGQRELYVTLWDFSAGGFP